MMGIYKYASLQVYIIVTQTVQGPDPHGSLRLIPKLSP